MERQKEVNSKIKTESISAELCSLPVLTMKEHFEKYRGKYLQRCLYYTLGIFEVMLTYFVLQLTHSNELVTYFIRDTTQLGYVSTTKQTYSLSLGSWFSEKQRTPGLCQKPRPRLPSHILFIYLPIPFDRHLVHIISSQNTITKIIKQF